MSVVEWIYSRYRFHSLKQLLNARQAVSLFIHLLNKENCLLANREAMTEEHREQEIRNRSQKYLNF